MSFLTKHTSQETLKTSTAGSTPSNEEAPARHNNDPQPSWWSTAFTPRRIAAGVLLGSSIAAGAGLLTRYRVCNANEYMVRTGLGITDMIVSKKGFHFPFQRLQIYSMLPRSYRFNLHNMSKEKVPFNLPTVFTVAPFSPDSEPELFKNYARTMTNISPSDLESTIRSIIHGETRVLTAEMTIEEMFSDKEKFKRMVQDNIQRDLNQFGMKVANSNIEEMGDMEDSKYFVYLRQKAIEGANNAARVEVATARKLGDIGEQEKQAETTQCLSRISSETTQVQNERDRVVAESNKNLSIARSEYQKLEQLASIDAQMTAKTRAVELQQLLESKRVQAEIETRRAIEFVEAKVWAESSIERAEAEAEVKRRLANADLYSEQKKAEAVRTMLAAQAEGLAALVAACRQNPQLLQFYLAQNSGLFVELAKQTATAVKDMKPSVHVWNTGAGGGDDPFAFIKQLMSSVPPMLDVLQQQTTVGSGFSKPGKPKVDDLGSNHLS